MAANIEHAMAIDDIFNSRGTAGHSRKSRQESQKLIESALLADKDAVSHFVGLITKEASAKNVGSPGDSWLLLQWTNTVVTSENGKVTLGLLAPLIAKLLFRVLSDPASKAPLRRVSTRQTRTALAQLLRQDAKSTLEAFFQAPGSLEGIVGIAVLASAAADAAGDKPEAGEILKTHEKKVAETYCQTVLSGKPTQEVLNILPYLSPIFTDLLSQTSFDEVIVPALQKALLRAPESVLQSTLPAILDVSRGVLYTDIATKQLASSLVSNLSSSSQALRQACASTYESLLRNAKDPFVDDLLKFVTKATNSEQRQLAAKALLGAPATVGADALATAAGKEATESGIHALALSLRARLASEAAVKAFEKGVSDSRAPLKREWISALAEGQPIPATSLPEALRAQLVKSWQDITKNIGTAITSKLLPAAWALLLIPGLVPVSEYNEQHAQSLFEPRAYDGSFSSPAQLNLCARAGSLVATPTALSAVVKIAAAASSSDTRMIAADVLKSKMKSEPSLQVSLARAVHDYLQTDAPQRVVPIMGSFTTAESLLDIFVIAHDKRASVRGGWIALALQARVDPGKLVEENATSILEMCIEGKVLSLASEALATAAFVAPLAISPLVAAHLERSLVVIPLDAEDKAILATKEGEVARVTGRAAAPTSRGKQSVDDWEAKVRAEVAAKKGQLTKEEKALVADQTVRRRELQAEESKISNAALIAQVLGRHTAEGVDNGALHWFPVATERLMIVAKADQLGAASAEAAIMSMSNCLSSRFPNKAVVGSLLLKPTTQKIVKVLYKLNPLADHRPLDPVSLVYVLPILVYVLRTLTATIGATTTTSSRPKEYVEADEDQDEEAQLLTLGLLANQAEVLGVVPRPGLVDALLALVVATTDKGSVKDCLLRVAQGVLFEADELKAILDSVVSPQDYLRSITLEVIDTEIDLTDIGYAPQIDIARHIPELSSVAKTVWEESGLERAADFSTVLDELEPFLGVSADIRSFVAKTYASASRDNVDEAFDRLMNLYRLKKQPPPKILDEYGLEVKQHFVDPVPFRAGILLALSELVPNLSVEKVLEGAEFVVSDAITDLPLANEALDLGKLIVDLHGKAQMDGLLPIFAGRNVVLYAWESLHLPAGDERLTLIVDDLLASLKTCDAATGERAAVADCLEQLARRIEAQPVLERLLAQTFSAKEPLERWVAAYGLAGLAAGLGLVVIGDYSIVRQVEQNVEDKRDPGPRHGAQVLVAALAERFGTKFEPYALRLMPEVLAGLGDGQAFVREAAAEAARAIMQHTTAFGVQKQVPLALRRLDTNQWRSKKGAVELLGTMAYLDPRQLAVSLSTVVPELAGVLNDTHREVRAAAKASLQTFGDVIENPEIRALVPILLEAIGDPPAKTEAALTALLRTRFVHYVDSPSLALVISVVQRGLSDRSASTKRRACQIVGNMSILTAGPDLIPYLPTIIPSLEVAMTDPVPATSATACKALGVLVQKLGEDQFPNVIPQMLENLADPEKTSDRWGTAQGLAEVLHGLGLPRLEAVLPSILQGWSSPQTHVRQGFAPLLLLLPSSFGASLVPYLPQLVTPLLRALADVTEDIREMALKAGRRIVRSYAQQSVELLLPELERGLGSGSWRIRLASVELLGDLLMQLSGKSATDKPGFTEAPPGAEGEAVGETPEGDAAEEEDEADDNEPAARHPLAQLGLSNGDRILAGLFMCRADVVPAVRQAALETWMSLVPNTPRAVKAILATLVKVVVLRLGDDDAELRDIGGRALAELVRRVSGALAQILPTLEKLNATDPGARFGICSGLVELIEVTPPETLREFHAPLSQLVREGLTDSTNPATREAATKALNALHSAVGDSVGDLLPGLVAQAAAGDEGALAALREMPGAFAKAVPAFLEPPLTLAKATGLAELAQFADAEIWQHVERVVEALLPHTEYAAELDTILHVACPEAYLLSAAKGDDTLRENVFNRMAHLYNARKEDGQSLDLVFASDWLNLALLTLEETSNVSRAAAAMVGALAAAATKAQQAQLATPAYHALRLAGPSTPGLTPPNFILPIFVQGLVGGTNAEKEHGALGLSETVHRVPPEALKPVITQITGPLIRVVGERAAPEVKAAVLYALHELLKAVPTYLRPFLPQLQRTFAKNLSESAAPVRTRAAAALGELIKHQTRVDPLIKELVNSVKAAQTTSPGVYEATLQALLEVVVHAGQYISEPMRQQVAEIVVNSEISGPQAVLLARLAASLAALEPEIARSLVKDGASSVGSVLASHALWVYAPDVARTMSTDLVSTAAQAALKDQQTFSDTGVRALGAALLNSSGLPTSDAELAVKTLTKTIEKSENRSLDTRRLSLITLGLVSQRNRELIEPVLDDLTLPLFAAARDTVIPVKLAAEKAFLYVFDLVGRQNSSAFDEWFATAKSSMPENTQRSLSEWVRRVAMRHAAREAEAADQGTSQDDAQELHTVA